MYKRLDDEAYSRLRKDLLKKETIDLQKEFLTAARSNAELLTFMQDVCGIGTKGTKDLETYDDILTEAQYINPPEDTELSMYEQWKDIPPETACRVTFWGEVTLNHIRQGKIEAHYLATSSDTVRGINRIQKALANDGDIQACVLNVLRSMSGLPEKRGNISVYANCPFSRAWWRIRLAHEVQKTVVDVCKQKDPDVFEKVLKLLRLKNEGWETIMRWVISRNSVLGDTKTRDLLVWILAEKLASTKKASDFTLLNSETIRKICRTLGVRCAWQELSLLDVDELMSVIESDVKLAIG